MSFERGVEHIEQVANFIVGAEPQFGKSWNEEINRLVTHQSPMYHPIWTACVRAAERDESRPCGAVKMRRSHSV